MNLGKGRLDQGTIDDGIDGVLRRFVVGGPKPSHPSGGETFVTNGSLTTFLGRKAKIIIGHR